ncbi:Uncharacterized protein PBTT_07899 [Plasmodiophora brassicae]
MLFKPEANLTTLLSYFEDPHAIDYLRDPSAEWIHECLHRRVPLRPQILLPDHLLNGDHDIDAGHFRMMLKTIVVDWRLADGYALGVAIRHTSQRSADIQHRERALRAFQFLRQHSISFLDVAGFDAYAASASERIAASDKFPVPYDERDSITSALLQLLPEHHRNLVRMALSGLAYCDIEEQIRNGDLDFDLLKVMVAHGMDITGLLDTATTEGYFRAANLLIMLGSDMNPHSYSGGVRGYTAGSDEAFTFAEHLMTFLEADDDFLAYSYWGLALHFEPLRRRLRLPNDNKPVLLETCLGALRRRFGDGFDERNWKRRVLALAIGDEFSNRLPVRQLLAMFDDDTVILSGPGVSALTNLFVCGIADPVTVLDRLVRHATDDQVQAALRHVNEDGYTIFHKKCMTGHIVKWILRRASSRDWIWGALQRVVKGDSCMEFWMRSPSHEQHVVPIVAVLAAANRTMSSYEVAMVACAGSPRGKVAFLSRPPSTTLIISHLAPPLPSRVNRHHAAILFSKARAEPLATTLNLIRNRRGDGVLQRFLLGCYDGLSVIHWAVMMGLPAVEIVLAQGKRLGILNEVVVHRDVPAGWTILHTAAHTVYEATRYAVHVRDVDVFHRWRQHLDGLMEKLSQMVISLHIRLASLDDFCRLVDARDKFKNRTFLNMLSEVTLWQVLDDDGSNDCIRTVERLFMEVVSARHAEMSTFIQQRCHNGDVV